MIRASIMDDVFAGVIQRVTDALTVFGDYVFIGELWVGVVILALVAGYVAIMVPWQWARSALGSCVAAAVFFAIGAQTMFNRMRGENKAVRDRNRDLEREKRDKDRGGSWF